MRKVTVALLVLFSLSAFAQMHGGGGMPGSPMPGQPGQPGTGSYQMSMGGMLVVPSLDGNLVLYTSIKSFDRSELVALSSANGTKAWSVALDGVAMHVTPGAGQFYVVVAKVSQETRTATRSIVAVSASGTVLWTQPIV